MRCGSDVSTGRLTDCRQEGFAGRTAADFATPEQNLGVGREGRANAGKIAGVVKSTTGAAISGVTVKITGGKVATTVNTTTNSTGNYGTTWISVGAYTITISKTGHTTQSKSATVNTGATTTVNFTMQ